MMSLARIQEPPDKGLILLAGVPGAGKSTFCHEVVLKRIAADRPVIFVTSDRSPTEVIELLSEKGIGEPARLNFVDAFTETVGLRCTQRSDTVCANCADLNSLSIAITRLQEEMGPRGVLLVFDSLTSPYLFNGVEVVKFMRLFLSKFAAEGNSVLALMDEGCGKEEDVAAMMSFADGIIRMEMRESSRTLNVVKHPKLPPTKVETPMTWSTMVHRQKYNPGVDRRLVEVFTTRPGKPMRTEVGDLVNLFWMNLASWSGMFWDPKRFPAMAYEFDKEAESNLKEYIPALLPWNMKLIFKIFIPKSFSEVKGMRRVTSNYLKMMERMGGGIGEYITEASKRNEHYIRIHENPSCWGFDNVGARLAFHSCGMSAGSLKGLEKEEKDWNIVETKCVGLGDPYCEFKAVPAELSELKDFLEAIDSLVVEKVHDRLMEHLTGYLVYDKPLPERPRLGNGVWFHMIQHVTSLPALFSERYRMALRMGGAKTGQQFVKHLTKGGLNEDEVIKRVVNFMDYCKVGKVTLGETIKIKQNCETFGLDVGELSCYFTTGFLNGLFSATKNQHVREVKCIAAGDPYCEWEIV